MQQTFSKFGSQQKSSSHRWSLKKKAPYKMSERRFILCQEPLADLNLSARLVFSGTLCQSDLSPGNPTQSLSFVGGGVKNGKSAERLVLDDDDVPY